YPGAEGIPMSNGVPTVCVRDPKGDAGCVAPYHTTSDYNTGGAHGHQDAVRCINGGKMDGFLAGSGGGHDACQDPNNPNCGAYGDGGQSQDRLDPLSYHTRDEIPNYWSYADQFVLQDHMFESIDSWSLPAHLYMVSGWSASCTGGDPMTCQTNLVLGLQAYAFDYAWTDITWLLHKHHASWRYYLGEGSEPDCADGAQTCPGVPLKG